MPPAAVKKRAIWLWNEDTAPRPSVAMTKKSRKVKELFEEVFCAEYYEMAGFELLFLVLLARAVVEKMGLSPRRRRRWLPRSATGRLVFVEIMCPSGECQGFGST